MRLEDAGMLWEELPDWLDAYVEKAAGPASDLRKAVAGIFTSADVGYYYHPITEKVALFAPHTSQADISRCKAAACRAVGRSNVHVTSPFLSYQELANPHSCWVKVAYSPVLRRLGELTNFFPGQYPGGIPNSPSPVAAMLTSGLLGVGLGWGGGKLLSSVMPNRFGDNLPMTGALVGGAIGAAPGAVWGATNQLSGKKFNDDSLLKSQANALPTPQSSAMDGANMVPSAPVKPEHNEVGEYLHNFHLRKHGEDILELLDGIKLGTMYKTAVVNYCHKVAGDTFAQPHFSHAPSPLDVNINALGQTLWDTGASPNLAGTTMGAMYAAQQMPDQRSQPGWVTAEQLGSLAQNAAGDYARGLLVGAAINTAIGTPFRTSTFGAGNAALGILGAVIPKLFGG